MRVKSAIIDTYGDDFIQCGTEIIGAAVIGLAGCAAGLMLGATVDNPTAMLSAALLASLAAAILGFGLIKKVFDHRNGYEPLWPKPVHWNPPNQTPIHRVRFERKTPKIIRRKYALY